MTYQEVQEKAEVFSWYYDQLQLGIPPLIIPLSPVDYHKLLAEVYSKPFPGIQESGDFPIKEIYTAFMLPTGIQVIIVRKS